MIHSEHGTVIFRGTDPEKAAELIALSLDRSCGGERMGNSENSVV